MSLALAFRPRRPDGRSNSEVIVALVRHAEPGQVYTYEQIGAALAEGTEREFERHEVQQAVREARGRLSREVSRALRNVPGVGYRLIEAKEHMSLAVDHTKRSERQLRRGLEVLSHVRLDEMDDNSRRLHEGHLLVASALYQNQVALGRRQSRIEEQIAKLTRRVDRISPEQAEG